MTTLSPLGQVVAESLIFMSLDMINLCSFFERAFLFLMEESTLASAIRLAMKAC